MRQDFDTCQTCTFFYTTDMITGRCQNDQSERWLQEIDCEDSCDQHSNKIQPDPPTLPKKMSQEN